MALWELYITTISKARRAIKVQLRLSGASDGRFSDFGQDAFHVLDQVLYVFDPDRKAE